MVTQYSSWLMKIFEIGHKIKDKNLIGQANHLIYFPAILLPKPMASDYYMLVLCYAFCIHQPHIRNNNYPTTKRFFHHNESIKDHQ